MLRCIHSMHLFPTGIWKILKSQISYRLTQFWMKDYLVIYSFCIQFINCLCINVNMFMHLFELIRKMCKQLAHIQKELNGKTMDFQP